MFSHFQILLVVMYHGKQRAANKEHFVVIQIRLTKLGLTAQSASSLSACLSQIMTDLWTR
jgi:hypothetical protein